MSEVFQRMDAAAKAARQQIELNDARLFGQGPGSCPVCKALIELESAVRVFVDCEARSEWQSKSQDGMVRLENAELRTQVAKLVALLENQRLINCELIGRNGILAGRVEALVRGNHDLRKQAEALKKENGELAEAAMELVIRLDQASHDRERLARQLVEAEIVRQRFVARIAELDAKAKAAVLVATHPLSVADLFGPASVWLPAPSRVERVEILRPRPKGA